MSVNLPLIIEPEELKQHLTSDSVLIVDLSSPATYVQYHIPGAVFLNYEWVVRIEHPRMGLLPTEEQLNNVFTSLGLMPDTHVPVDSYGHSMLPDTKSSHCSMAACKRGQTMVTQFLLLSAIQHRQNIKCR